MQIKVHLSLKHRGQSGGWPLAIGRATFEPAAFFVRGSCTLAVLAVRVSNVFTLTGFGQ